MGCVLCKSVKKSHIPIFLRKLSPFMGRILDFVTSEELIELSNINRKFKISGLEKISKLKKLDSRKIDSFPFYYIFDRLDLTDNLLKLTLSNLEMPLENFKKLQNNFKYLQKLEKLVIFNMYFATISTSDFFMSATQYLKELRHLDISHCLDFKVNLSNLKNTPNIKFLKLSRISEILVESFHGILSLTNLEHLDLYSSCCSNFCFYFSENIDKFPLIKFINFAKNDIHLEQGKLIISLLSKTIINLKVDLTENYLYGIQYKNTEYSLLELNVSNQFLKK